MLMLRMGKYRFPFTEPTLFLASPGDVRYLRNIARGVIAEVIHGYSQVDGLRVFAWEHETASTPFDDREPAQEQIPPPNDPLCRGVIAFFGEWIGRPLAEDFPLDALAPLQRVLWDGRYRLAHPWKPQAAASGGFPLTGSTFEVLSTLATHRRAKEDGTVRSVPLFLRFVGPKELLDEPDVGKARWGSRRLRRQVQLQYENDDEEQIRRGRLVREQLIQLRNFALFLNEVLGDVTNFVADEDDAAEQLRRWLLDDLALAPIASDRDQFKGLVFYDVEDTDVFYGRENDSRLALSAIRLLWKTTGTPKWYWVRGVSGAGKSSFLRAGIVGPLVKRSHEREGYAQCVVRPAELILGTGYGAARQHHSPLRSLFNACLAQVLALGGQRDAERTVKSRLAEFDLIPETNQPAWAVQVLGSLVSDEEASGGPGAQRRLLIGLDQFEDIVDALHDAETSRLWERVVEFAMKSSECPGILVLATIRDDRIVAMEKLPTLGPFYRQTMQSRSFLELPSRGDLEQVIRRPFASVRGLVLSGDFVPTLGEKLQAFIDSSTHGKARPSLLPLVSLTLERLYRQVALPLIQEYRHPIGGDAPGEKRNLRETADVASAFGRAAEDAVVSDVVVLSPEKAGDYLEIKRAISVLAEEAVAEAKQATGPNWEDTAIGTLLRRLIAWTGAKEQLFNLPAVDWPRDDSVVALARAMKARRLILEEENHRIRLVHEAVVNDWPRATAWLESEKPLLKELNQLLELTVKWTDPGLTDAAESAGILLRHVPKAAQLLSVWFDILDGLPRESDPDGRAALRDFCLALLARHDQPKEIVRDAPRQPSHLHLATSYQRTDIVRRMLAHAPDAVAVRRADARTPLFMPAFQGNLEMVALLLEHGADPDAADEQKWRPVHAAAMTESLDVVARLVETGARLDAAGAPGGTAPIHTAAASDRPAVIEYFVKSHAVAVDIRDDAGLTPLMRAASSNQVRAIRALIQLDADVRTTARAGTDEDMGWTALHLAARDGAAAAIDVLIEAGLDSSAPLLNGVTPLHLAAQRGQLACMTGLIASGASLEAGALNLYTSAQDVRKALTGRTETAPHPENGEFDRTPLHVAVTQGHRDAMLLLLDAKANIDARTGSGATPLHLCATSNQAALAALLLARGAQREPRDAAGHTPLLSALEKRTFTVAQTLLEAGAASDATMDLPRQVTSRQPLRVTALQKAAHEGNEDVLRFLLGQRVDLAIIDARGWTALHYAAAAGHAKAVGWLLGRGAGAQVRDASGMTAFHLASRNGHAPVVKTFLSTTVVDWSADEGPTALHLAAHAGSAPTIEELLAADHPIDPRDPDGWTPLHCAAQAGSEACVDALLRAGADPRLIAERVGLVALQLAARTGDVACLRRLLASPLVSVDEAPGDSPTAVVLAMRYRQFEAVGVLLEAGAAADTRDPETGLDVIEPYRLHVLAQRASEDGRLAASDTAPPGGTALSLSPPVQPGATAFFPDLNRASDSPWSQVVGDELSGFLIQISPVDGKHVLEPEDTAVHWRRLPFYENVALIHVSTPALRAINTRLCYLTDQGNLYRLNGTSPPIHEVNAKAPIALSERNVLDYLRFFCFFVRGEEGPFYLAEVVDDPLLPRHMGPVEMSVLEEAARPATLQGIDERGHFLCSAVLSYSNAIFVADFAVQPTGMVEMLDDDPIAADLPGRVSIALS